MSVLENNTNIHFHVLSNDFSENSRSVVATIMKRYGNCDVKYHSVDISYFARFTTTIEYITIETYFRYMIADILKYEDKCLYLDADLVVDGNLDALYKTDLEEFYCAGVSDGYIDEILYKEKIGFQRSDVYVNAGVLLFNLKKIRKDGIVKKLIENTNRLKDVIKFQDQDIINITLKGKIKPLDSIYNYTSNNVGREKWKRFSAIIIHYTGAGKPWHKDCSNKMRGVWRKYYNLSKKIQGFSEEDFVEILKDTLVKFKF